ncbi:MAG TPA: ATP-binding protein [Acidimicrobiia bacterium]|jgi:serine/threonine-protein kinase RsbW|nr:ATP-binding protein [Acidimicrobiia bacterium]
MADESAPSGTRVADVVRLSFPGSLEYVRVARMTASAVAARLGFDVEEIEDVRVAVDELASVVIEAGDGGELSISFSDLGGRFVIEGRAPVVAAPQFDELTQQILSVVVDEFDLSTMDGFAEFRAAKRPAPTE